MVSQSADMAASSHHARRSSSVTASTAGPHLIEAKYLMTRERATTQAGCIVNRLGNRSYDQAALAPDMAAWLSKPVIKVLNEDMKNKVYMWCGVYSPGWLDTIRAADEDLSEYRYVSSIEEANPLDITPAAFQESVKEQLDTLKKELIEAQRAETTAVLSKLEHLQSAGQISSELPNKRRRTSTRSSYKNATDNLEKLDEALRHVFGDDSEVVQCLHELAVSVEPNFSSMRSEPKEKTLWSKEQLNTFREEARGSGLNVLQYKLLDRTIQEMEDASLPMTNVAALSRQITSSEQYENLEEKFGFPFICDKE